MILVRVAPNGEVEPFFNVEMPPITWGGRKIYSLEDYLSDERMNNYSMVDDALVLYGQCVRAKDEGRCSDYHLDEARDVIASAVVDRLTQIV